DPNQRPTIENIFNSLGNIKLENIFNDSNDNQLEVNINNQSQASADVFNRDSISAFTTTTESSTPLSTYLTTTPNSSNYYNVTIGNQIMKYNYNDFKNLKNIGRGTFGMIYSATLMKVNGKNRKRTVALKSIVVTTMELFVNEDELDLIVYISQGNREDPIIGTPHDYIKIYQDCWNQFPDQRPNIGKVVQDLECIDLKNILAEITDRYTNKPVNSRTPKRIISTWISNSRAAFK
ncbi:4669_t:CDS:2, partial [Diversispora eburnea]